MNEYEKFLEDFDSLKEKYEKKFNKEFTTIFYDLDELYDLMKKSLDEGKDYVPDDPDYSKDICI